MNIRYKELSAIKTHLLEPIALLEFERSLINPN